MVDLSTTLCGPGRLARRPGRETQETKHAARPAHHRVGGGFRNLPGRPKRAASYGELARFLFRQLTSARTLKIPDDHVMNRAAMAAQMAQAGNPSVTWLGHAAFIVRIGGKIVLTDPFLGERAGPFGFGPKRFVAAPMRADELPEADVMVVSHNHYDHLDAGAISAYRFKETTQVIVPLGLGSFFIRRGYRKVLEQDWWDMWESDGLTITALPAVHFSGRGLFDSNKSLWASFAIAAGGERVWFSGDTANGEVFPEIGRRAGPFDLALIGIGAYEPRGFMRSVHASPEDAVQIARAVRARRAVGMHWGTIVLTPEDPFEPPVRFRQAAIDQGYGADNAVVLKIGESHSFAARD